MSVAIDTRRQDITTARKGQPFTISLLLDGDQTGNAVVLTLAPRHAAADAVPTITLPFGTGTVQGAGAEAQTPASVEIPATGAPGMDDLDPGTVYVYHVRIDAGSDVVWGEFHVHPAWG